MNLKTGRSTWIRWGGIEIDTSFNPLSGDNFSGDNFSHSTYADDDDDTGYTGPASDDDDTGNSGHNTHNTGDTSTYTNIGLDEPCQTSSRAT